VTVCQCHKGSLRSSEVILSNASISPTNLPNVKSTSDETTL